MWDPKSAKIHTARLKWKPTMNNAAAMQDNSDKVIIGTSRNLEDTMMKQHGWIQKQKKSYR